jgi:hypothetical protein
LGVVGFTANAQSQGAIEFTGHVTFYKKAIRIRSFDGDL